MKTSTTAYERARSIDHLVNAALRDYPPSPDNLHNWRIYVRTIQSTINIVNTELDRIEAEGVGRDLFEERDNDENTNANG